MTTPGTTDKTPMTTAANNSSNNEVGPEESITGFKANPAPVESTVDPIKLGQSMLEAAGFYEFQGERDDQIRFGRSTSGLKAIINKKLPSKVLFFNSETPTDRTRRMFLDVFTDQSMFGRIISMWYEESAKAQKEAAAESESAEDTDICNDCLEAPCDCKRQAAADFVCECGEENCVCPNRPLPQDADDEYSLRSKCTGNCEGTDAGFCTCEDEGLLDDDATDVEGNLIYEFLPEHALEKLSEHLLYSGTGISEALDDMGMFSSLYNINVIRERLLEHGLEECGTCGWWMMVDELNSDDECASCETDTQECEREIEREEIAEAGREADRQAWTQEELKRMEERRIRVNL